MKKIFLFLVLLLSIFSFAQNPLLIDNNWKITKILYQNVEYPIPVPVIAPEIHSNSTTFTTVKIDSKLVNTSFGTIDSISDSQLIIEGMSGTLSQSPNSDFALFEENYRNIFMIAPTPKTFEYSITDLGSGNYVLILSDNTSGNKVYYQNIVNPTNNLLIENKWSIKSLKIGSQVFSPSLTGKNLKFTATNAFVSYFNYAAGYINYDSQSPEFSLSNSYVSMADPFNLTIAEFDGNYLENFWGTRILSDPNYISPKNPFTYNITSDGNTLTITNANGDVATYSKAILSTKDVQKSNLKLYPNPTSDIIFIENLKTNSSVKILDISGKVVLSKKLSGNSLDVKSLLKGTYFIELEGEKPLKFIKK